MTDIYSSMYHDNPTMESKVNPTESEMNMVTEVFSKMRDSVIEASALASEVAKLRVQVDEIAKETDNLRQTNRWMDGQIVELRRARDDAEVRYGNASNERDEVKRERDRLQTHSDNQSAELHRLNEEVTTLRVSRDKAQDEALDWMVKCDDATEKLKVIEALFAPKPSIPSTETAPFSPSVSKPWTEQDRTPTGQFLPKRGEPGFVEPQEEPVSEYKRQW